MAYADTTTVRYPATKRSPLPRPSHVHVHAYAHFYNGRRRQYRYLIHAPTPWHD
ncbi:hypothetical protein K491DRAFT_696233 [Lophiostoma macrostomum CBS 122681]|uniref:Uncharacterized protein n=1 Tax=Lophiostoma macrostomum CBS 122681 TaxID=1314788 RepID=A0A6A6SYY9_9PLEO|nr:hypothetical protein K491DRAFT_696233 [Lophiostoma macrostomum CBS 122681]